MQIAHKIKLTRLIQKLRTIIEKSASGYDENLVAEATRAMSEVDEFWIKIKSEMTVEEKDTFHHMIQGVKKYREYRAQEDIVPIKREDSEQQVTVKPEKKPEVQSYHKVQKPGQASLELGG